MFCVERVALDAVEDLELIEGSYLWLVEQREAEAMALAMAFLGRHLAATTRRLQMAMVITESEQAIRAGQPAVGPEGHPGAC